MYATVGEDGPEERRAHRLVNAWELAKLIRTSARLGRYVIVVSFTILCIILNLTQTFRSETSTAYPLACQ